MYIPPGGRGEVSTIAQLFLATAGILAIWSEKVAITPDANCLIIVFHAFSRFPQHKKEMSLMDTKVRPESERGKKSRTKMPMISL
jgi:hypothetical protein